MTEPRICTQCGEEKSLREFKKDNRKPGGRAYICKACDNKARTARIRARKHSQKKVPHSTGLYNNAGADTVRTVAPPVFNIGADGANYDDEGREIHEFTPDQIQLVQYLASVPYAGHWQYDLQMIGLMGHPDDHPCAVCGDDAIMFHGFGESALDFAPTCMECAESDDLRANGVHWSYDMFIRVYEAGEADPTGGILREIKDIPDALEGQDRLDALLSIFYACQPTAEAIRLMVENEVIFQPHEHDCYLCEREALEFTPWNRNALEIVPTCHTHTGVIEFDLAQRWYLDYTDWQGTFEKFLEPVEYV